MASTWNVIPNTLWEYDSTPPEPTAGTPEHDRWSLQTLGIRTSYHLGDIPVEIYQYCRLVIDGELASTGEISKSQFD